MTQPQLRAEPAPSPPQPPLAFPAELSPESPAQGPNSWMCPLRALPAKALLPTPSTRHGQGVHDGRRQLGFVS